MRLFGILLIFANLIAGGAFVYFATQDWKGRQTINAAGVRHLLVLQGLPLEGDDFNAEDETPFVMERSEEHTSELQSRQYLVCRLLLEKKNDNDETGPYGYGCIVRESSSAR